MDEGVTCLAVDQPLKRPAEIQVEEGPYVVAAGTGFTPAISDSTGVRLVLHA